MKKYTFLISLILSSFSFAGTPTCHEHPGGNYCQYNGTVNRIYVNSGNTILVYFDSSVDVGIPQSVGFDVTTGSAAALRISDNPEFATMFYSTALAAQASKRSISIQMRGRLSGYMKIDRIWLSE